MEVSGSEVAIKADRAFFHKLVTIAKVRDLDLHDVYSYELGPIPWPLATAHGTLCKTDRLVLIKELGMAIIQVLKEPEVEAFQRRTKWKPKTFADMVESILFCICHTSNNAI